jgi:hypothetical protein
MIRHGGRRLVLLGLLLAVAIVAVVLAMQGGAR